MIVTIIGARPQFIKAAIVSIALREVGIQEAMIHTGQHYDEQMSDVFWKELGLPVCEINLQAGSGNHGKQTALMIEKIEEYLINNAGNIKAVLLYGDTNSTLAGSVAASKLNIPIIHVEAGLRSFNRRMPEEINRIVTDHLSQLLFCSSAEGVSQLASEGITNGVYEVGDVMFDAMQYFLPMAKERVRFDLLFPGLQSEKFSLLTVHRPVNTDNKKNLISILSAIDQINEQVVWPVHPRIKDSLQGISLPRNIILSEPLSYFEMLIALHSCSTVFTDSGGLQKEAYWSRKPCITLRDETEWVETLHNNWNILVSASTEKITAAFNCKIDKQTWVPLYGDGNSSKLIAQSIKELLCNG